MNLREGRRSQFHRQYEQCNEYGGSIRFVVDVAFLTR